MIFGIYAWVQGNTQATRRQQKPEVKYHHITETWKISIEKKLFDLEMQILVLFWALIGLCIARPPAKPQAAKPSGGETKPAGNGTAEDWDLNIEYNRYLQEVVQVLESDPEFR